MEARTTAFIDLITSDPGCVFPCWGNIILGETTPFELQARFQALGIPLTVFERDDGIEIHSTGFQSQELTYIISFFTLPSTATVDWIEIHLEGVQSGTLFAAWQQLIPERLVAFFGPPKRIELITDAVERNEPQFEKPYWINFYFEDERFMIGFEGAIKNAPTYHFCPTYAANGNLGNGIQVYIISATEEKNLRQVIEIIGGYRFDPSTIRIFEQIVPLTNNDLSELYLENTEVCFDAPKSTWDP